MDARSIVEVIAALTIPICVVSIIWQRVKSGRGLGASALRFSALSIVVPAAVVLSLENVLEAGAVGSIFGTVVGFLFSDKSKPLDNVKA